MDILTDFFDATPGGTSNHNYRNNGHKKVIEGNDYIEICFDKDTGETLWRRVIGTVVVSSNHEDNEVILILPQKRLYPKNDTSNNSSNNLNLDLSSDIVEKIPEELPKKERLFSDFFLLKIKNLPNNYERKIKDKSCILEKYFIENEAYVSQALDYPWLENEQYRYLSLSEVPCPSICKECASVMLYPFILKGWDIRWWLDYRGHLECIFSTKKFGSLLDINPETGSNHQTMNHFKCYALEDENKTAKLGVITVFVEDMEKFLEVPPLELEKEVKKLDLDLFP